MLLSLTPRQNSDEGLQSHWGIYFSPLIVDTFKRGLNVFNTFNAGYFEQEDTLQAANTKH